MYPVAMTNNTTIRAIATRVSGEVLSSGGALASVPATASTVVGVVLASTSFGTSSSATLGADGTGGDEASSGIVVGGGAAGAGGDTVTTAWIVSPFIVSASVCSPGVPTVVVTR